MIIESWVLFFLWWVKEDGDDDKVTMLFLTSGEWIFFLGWTLLGVMKLGGLTFLEDVSEWMEEEVFDS